MDVAPSSPGSPPRTRLTGWKEIAAYFDRGVRTVQRWERDLGLPVRRMGTGRSETVHAFPHELERWQRGLERRTDLSAQPGEEDPPGTAAENRPVPETAPRGARLSRPFFATVALAILSLAAASFYFFQRSGEPATYKVDVDCLHVYDARGRELWTYQFPYRLAASAYKEREPWGRPPVAIGDYDGDGRRDLVMQATDGKQGIFFWFEGRTGKVRYQYRPEASVRYGRNEFPPPWNGQVIFVTDGPGGSHVWAAWSDGTRGEFPSMVKRMTPRGPAEASYWSAGYPQTMFFGYVAGRPSTFLCAANNDTRNASLAVFDGLEVRGHSPATTEDKTCYDCPAGSPRFLLDFPAQEMRLAANGIPVIAQIRQDQENVLKVGVDQGGTPPPLPGPLPAFVFYTFDGDLRLLAAEFSEQYAPLHALFEQARALDHPFDPREAEKLLPLHFWDGKKYVSMRIGDAPKPIAQ